MNKRRRTDAQTEPSAVPANIGDARSRKTRGLALDFPVCNPVFLPTVRCIRHGEQPSAYWICWHIECAGARVHLRIEATAKLSGELLCKDCADNESLNIKPGHRSYRTVRLACPICVHAAGLIDSPEVRP